MEEPNRRKRPRPVVSCLRCRDKKLKCDRTAPCNNCVRAQVTRTCTYQHGNNPSSKESQDTSTVVVEAVEDLQLRLAKVEELLGIQKRIEINPTESSTPLVIGTVVVKGNRSIFHGQNDRTTLLNEFLEVKDFINEMSKDKQVQASAKQIKFLQNKSRSKIGSPDSIVGTDFSMALLKLQEFMPPKPYCDRLVSIYCQHFERTFRILHIPTFMRRYDQIWTNDNSDIHTSSSIIPETTAVMTMAYHMDDSQQLGDDRNHRTYLKGPAMDLVQAWLDELGRKQRTELSTLQVEILLLLSRSLRGLQPEKLWSSTGALVRSAMVMGLNVDTANITGMTPYNAEMRRRLWATILEIDLQASMFCGMPLVVPELRLESLLPSNINDTDFDEFSTTLPAPYPKHTYTDSLYQVILASSLPQRIKVLSLSQRSTPDLQEGISLGRNVEECLSQKPQVVSLLDYNSTPIDGGSLLHRVLLDLYLRRPILALYKALLLCPQQSSPILVELQKHCLDSSRVVLSYQDLYTIPALTSITHSPWAHQNFFYQCCKVDILWAALTLCQHVKQNPSLTPTDTTHNNTALLETVKNTITYLIDRIGQKGSDLKDIIFLALVLQSVQLPESAQDWTQAMHKAARTTLAACREKLLEPLVSTQPRPMAQTSQRASLDATTIATVRPSTVTPSLPDSISIADAVFPTNLPTNTDQWFGDLSDLAAEYTTFQAGMFDPNDPLNFGMAQSWNWEHMWQ